MSHDPEGPIPDYEVTPRTRLRRLPERGHYDRALIHGILDAGYLCHVGYLLERQPVVTPTSYWRSGEELYWHGSAASRMLRALDGGVPACLTVTHLDGLVLARSAFHHSMNYRSVMAFGIADLVSAPDEKREALRQLMERLVPGRWETVRQPTTQELAATLVLRMPLVDVSAKLRSGPPIDDEQDYAGDAWAGVIPIETLTRPAEPDPRLAPGIPLPAALG